jgi:hypothetical protein
VCGRLETADRWGRRDNEREGVGPGGRTAPTALAHGAARERARWRDRLTGGVCLSARAGAGAGARASWADLG